MMRILFYVLGLAAVTGFFAWLAEQPGTLHVNWLGYEIETDVFNLFLSLFILILAVVLIWNFFRRLVEAPEVLARFFKQRREKRGLEALTAGMIAIGAGDREQARRYAVDARKSLPNEPLTALLRAQSAQLMGDRGTARRIYEAMLESPDTELLGLRGLYLEAFQENETIAARQFAERAMQINPKLGWCTSALFGFQCRSGDWTGALKTLETARRNGHADKTVASRRRAVLLTAQASEAQDTDLEKAIELASEAHRLEPGLVPAAAIAGRLLASKGQTSRAARIISRTWKLSPHPDLALVYAHARPGDSPRDRLKRVHSLAQATPHDIEAAIALATAAIEAREWDEARGAISHLIQNHPTARLCTLMAQIEGGQFGDKGRVREWLARAVRAPRDAAWTAEGYVSDDWLPISPITGELDAFEWKVPIEALSAVETDAPFGDILPVGSAVASVLIPPSEAEIGDQGQDVSSHDNTPEDELVAGTTQNMEADDTAHARSKGSTVTRDKSAAPAEETAAVSWTGELRDLTESTPESDNSAESAGATVAANAEDNQTQAETAVAPEDQRETPEAGAPEIAHVADIADLPPTGMGDGEDTPVAEMPPPPPPPRPVTEDKATAVEETPAIAKPKIFVPPRAPDDPGPEPADPDEARTPLARYRMPAAKAK